jgi:CYTH domain-containing protein
MITAAGVQAVKGFSMAVEIERKFIVTGENWRPSRPGGRIRQGYLCTNSARSVRVRLCGKDAFLTVKGPSRGAGRLEFEYPIPAEDARDMLPLCAGGIIEKTRYKISHAGRVWDVDEFHGLNQGLILAEVELESEDAAVELPPWAGEEVTGDKRYYNLYLARHPFSRW